MSLSHLLSLFESPRTLLLAALICLAALPALARYFFGDFEEVKRDLGLDNSVGPWGWLLGGGLREYSFDWRAVGFAGVYLLLVLLVYQGLTKVEHWLHLGGS